jgi:hypothetical protein
MALQFRSIEDQGRFFSDTRDGFFEQRLTCEALRMHTIALFEDRFATYVKMVLQSVPEFGEYNQPGTDLPSDKVAELLHNFMIYLVRTDDVLIRQRVDLHTYFEDKLIERSLTIDHDDDTDLGYMSLNYLQLDNVSTRLSEGSSGSGAISSSVASSHSESLEETVGQALQALRPLQLSNRSSTLSASSGEDPETSDDSEASDTTPLIQSVASNASNQLTGLWHRFVFWFRTNSLFGKYREHSTTSVFNAVTVNPASPANSGLPRLSFNDGEMSATSSSTATLTNIQRVVDAYVTNKSTILSQSPDILTKHMAEVTIQDQVRQVRDENVAMCAQCRDLELVNRDLERANQDLVDTRSQLERGLIEAHNALRVALIEHNGFRQTITTQVAEIKSQATVIEDLRSQAEGESSRISQQARDHAQELARLRVELANAQSEVASSEQMLRGAEEISKDRDIQIAAQIERQKELEGRASRLTAQVEELTGQVEELTARYDGLFETHNMAMQAFGELADDLAGARDELFQLKTSAAGSKTPSRPAPAPARQAPVTPAKQAPPAVPTYGVRQGIRPGTSMRPMRVLEKPADATGAPSAAAGASSIVSQLARLQQPKSSVASTLKLAETGTIVGTDSQSAVLPIVQANGSGTQTNDEVILRPAG